MCDKIHDLGLRGRLAEKLMKWVFIKRLSLCASDTRMLLYRVPADGVVKYTTGLSETSKVK